METTTTADYPDSTLLPDIEFEFEPRFLPDTADCSTIYKSLYIIIGTIALASITWKLSKSVISFCLRRRKTSRWNNTKTDLVIAHVYPKAILVPNASPFAMKLLTYLRMANIPYEIDTKDYEGPKGKSPWISCNGEHIPDSHFIIKFLNKKFNINLNSRYSNEELAVATAMRVMIEEYLFWGVTLYRLDYCVDRINEIINLAPVWLVKLMLSRKIKSDAMVQGLGRHSEEEVRELMLSCLQALSAQLGQKKFIIGNEPCEDDAAIFGILSQFYFALPGSPFNKYFDGELENLKHYCLRMKQIFWSDWDDCVDN